MVKILQLLGLTMGWPMFMHTRTEELEGMAVEGRKVAESEEKKVESPSRTVLPMGGI